MTDLDDRYYFKNRYNNIFKMAAVQLAAGIRKTIFTLRVNPPTRPNAQKKSQSTEISIRTKI